MLGFARDVEMDRSAKVADFYDGQLTRKRCTLRNLHQNVLRLQVPMHHLLRMALSHSLTNLSHQELMYVHVELWLAFVFEVKEIFRASLQHSSQLVHILISYQH